MYKKVSPILICGWMLLSSNSLLASGPDLNPGKWEFVTTLTMPMMPNPQTISNIECFTEEDARKDPLATLLEEGSCELVSSEAKGNRMDFEVACQGDMGVTSTGKGHFTANGETASGMMEVTMDMPDMPNTGGQEMKMVQSWKGRRIGSCD